MFLKSNKPAAKIETIIGSGTEMEGNLQTNESIRVDGKVKGGIRAACVFVGEYGVVMGDINAANVTVAGKVKGNISAHETLELLAKGQVLGDLSTSKLIIADGANFEGNCKMVKGDGQIIELNPQNLSHELENQGHKNLKAVANGKH